MNKAITDGLVLMPPPFSAGLSVWSSGDGVPGSPTYQGAANAAYVPADQDFGGCLELQKTANTQKLRYMGQTPYRPGMYLRVTVRIKALSGNLPSVRIAGFPATAGGSGVSGVPVTGPEVALTAYGQVITVQAIIGSGTRAGVNLVWGMNPAYAHIGLDLTGANGGVLRIDDIVIEDITEAFHRDLMDWIDVRDYGAKGNGVTDDSAAFAAAEAAAAGRTILVSAGVYRITTNLTLNSYVRFEGTLSMPENARLALTRNYDLDTYAKAFGDENLGFRKAVQVLFHFTDHVTLDLNGRRVELTAPLDVAALAAAAGSSYTQRRLISNGQLAAVAGAEWNTTTVTSQATYSTGLPYVLSNVANIANIAIGSLVTGTGVARETYVLSKNVGAGTLELSLPPGATAGTRTYTFTRFRYMLDYSGFGRLDRMELTDIEFLCEGICSAIMLPPSGITFRVHGCVFTRPKDRAISSIGTGCQGMLIDECQFLSNEQPLNVQDRTSVCMNINANDAKIRDNRIVRFKHFAVVHGSGHMFIANHFFQGDSQNPGVRQAGLVFTGINVKSVVSGNYIDNCFVEMTNEREPDPNWNNQFSFGGVSITGNIFTTIGAVPGFAWLVITPYGSGHYIQGLSVTGNTFRTANGSITRAEKVDTSYADLDYSRFRNITVHGNNYNGVSQTMYNPVIVSHQQNTGATSWPIDGASFLPFGGWARVVTSVVAEGAISAEGTTRYDMPYVQTEQGATRKLVHLRWPVAVSGKVNVTIRVDNPV
ncbi:MAG: glycosyl hydrolase family 28-related protein [Gemmobacter sp.]|nr:glycosyl hydrolase family 28-related protein [Gemmobacter sp.]